MSRSNSCMAFKRFELRTNDRIDSMRPFLLFCLSPPTTKVRRAVSQGDEHRFLEIVAECGSSARGIIAKLLMSRESPT